MYILFNKHKEGEKLYKALGKALMLCHRFEESVNFVMTVLLSSHGYNLDKITIEDIFDTTRPAHKKIFNLTLGNRLKHPWLEDIVYFNPDNLKILTDGKSARNYLCHESTLSFSYGYDLIENYNSFEDRRKIRENVSNLCSALALISEFHYQIQEKEPSKFNRDKYAVDLENWVFD